jgi:hypothetical protein
MATYRDKIYCFNHKKILTTNEMPVERALRIAVEVSREIVIA